MPSEDESVSRTVVLSADRNAFPVVFEMLADTVVVQPHESLRLVMRGPAHAELSVGDGQDGVSVFRDDELQVEVYAHSGTRLSITGW